MIRKPVPLAEQQRILWIKYKLPAKEVAQFHEEGFSFLDLDKACLYAYITQKPVKDILKLRKTEYWMRIEKLLHITPELYYQRNLRYQAECAQRWWGMDAEKVYQLMLKGYPRLAIKLAWVLSTHSNKSIEDILAHKKRDIHWADWAQANLNINPDNFHTWVQTVLNPIYHPKKSLD